MMVSTFARENDDELIELKSEKGAILSELSIKYRPYLYDFLDDVSTKFELVLYSTFGYQQVQAIADALEKKKGKKYFSYRFHDEFCLFSNISYGVKCIDFLYGKRSAKDIIVVDTKTRTLPLNVDNFFSIEEFTGDTARGDMELVKLAKVLDELASSKDVTEMIKRYRTMK